MTMSAFLMNSAAGYSEPKFPPHEEYSQNNYFTTGQQDDLYRASTQPYRYMHDDRRYPQEGFSPPPSHQGYGCSSGAAQGSALHPGLVRGVAVGANPAVAPAGCAPLSRSPTSVPSPTPGTQAMPACSQSASAPPIIYPWMRKLHPGESDYITLCARGSVNTKHLYNIYPMLVQRRRR